MADTEASGPWSGRRLHLIGIAGAGMSAYALAARALGAQVSGSDRAESPYLEPVRAAGIAVAIGHDAANVPDDAELFHSSAIAPDNPERVAARSRGLDDRPRADLLGELTAMRRVIAIGGAHGKTTTTSMVAHALLGLGLDPGYLIGGVLTTSGTNAAWGTGEWLVVEADESDRSLLSLHTDVAVVTNVELDHHAVYGSLADLEQVFRAFLEGAPRQVVAPGLERLASEGAEAFAAGEVVLEPGGSRFVSEGETVRLVVPGAHNVLNAAAALTAIRVAGLDVAGAAAALASFGGAARRFQRLGETASGVPVVDDYAHHPTEVAATIAAARTLRPGRVVVVFQPHLYSRTRELAADFAAALAGADLAYVLGVYPARERAEDFPGISGETIVAAAGAARVRSAPTFDDAQAELETELRPGDLLLVLGAGDVDALARRLIAPS